MLTLLEFFSVSMQKIRAENSLILNFVPFVVEKQFNGTLSALFTIYVQTFLCQDRSRMRDIAIYSLHRRD